MHFIRPFGIELNLEIGAVFLDRIDRIDRIKDKNGRWSFANGGFHAKFKPDSARYAVSKIAADSDGNNEHAPEFAVHAIKRPARRQHGDRGRNAP